MAGVPPQRRLPVEPLLSALERAGYDTSGDTDPNKEGSPLPRRVANYLSRAKTEWGGVTLWWADEVCCHVLGVHPCAVYSDWFEIDTEEKAA